LLAGLALRGGDAAGHADLAARGIVERPRVLYHDATRRFIMWLHIDDEQVRQGFCWISCRPLRKWWHRDRHMGGHILRAGH